jgi:hypothetical protein
MAGWHIETEQDVNITVIIIAYASSSPIRSTRHSPSSPFTTGSTPG